MHIFLTENDTDLKFYLAFNSIKAQFEKKVSTTFLYLFKNGEYMFNEYLEYR